MIIITEINKSIQTQKRNSKEADMAEAYSDMENIDVFDFVEGLEREVSIFYSY